MPVGVLARAFQGVTLSFDSSDYQFYIRFDTLYAYAFHIGTCHAVIANCGSNEQNALTLVFLLDATQIFLSSRSAVSAGCGLSIRDQHEKANFLWPFGKLLCHKAKGSTVTVAGPGGDVHQPVLVIPVNAVELGIGV